MRFTRRLCMWFAPSVILDYESRLSSQQARIDLLESENTRLREDLASHAQDLKRFNDHTLVRRGEVPLFGLVHAPDPPPPPKIPYSQPESVSIREENEKFLRDHNLEHMSIFTQPERSSGHGSSSSFLQENGAADEEAING